MSSVNTLPQPSGAEYGEPPTQDLMLHKNFRVLVLGMDPETREPKVILPQIGKKLGKRPDGSVVKDYDLQTRRDPLPEEMHLTKDGDLVPSLDKLPVDETWVGHFQKFPAEAFKDASVAREVLENPLYRLSNKAARRVIELVQNRTERMLLRGRRAIAGNKPPLVPLRGEFIIDKETGKRKYRPGIEDLLPKSNEKPVSDRDFSIDIDRLERARLTDPSGKYPDDKDFDKDACGFVDIKVRDSHGRQPWEDGYDETIKRLTVPTRDEMEAYVSERHTKDTSDPRKDYFLKNPQLRQESAEPIFEDTLLDKMLVRLQLKFGHRLGENNAFSAETLTAVKNKAANEIVQTTQATGPDSILRGLDKIIVNEHGQFVDFETKKVVKLTEIFKRDAMIHLLEHKPEIIIGLFNYAKTKWPPDQIGELIEYFFDIAHEAHMKDDVFLGHMIGAFYGDKLEDNAWKNSSIVHPVKRYLSGPMKGHEIWTVRLDKDTQQPFYEDTDGKAWLAKDLKTDPETGKMYHEKTDKDGNSLKVWIKYLKNPGSDGSSTDEIDWYSENGVIKQRKVPIAPLKVMDPEYDLDKWVVGRIKLLSYVTEIGRRFRAGEFAFRESAMSALYLRVVELAEVMNANEYIPGFVDSKNSEDGIEALSFDDYRGRTNMARAMGRDSEMFRIAEYSMSMLWAGLSENLKQNYGGGGKDEDPDAIVQAFVARQRQLEYTLENAEQDQAKGLNYLRELDPKFYSGPAISNQFLKEIVLVLDSVARRFPAMKKPPIGDTLILGPNGQGQDILPLY